MSVTIKLLNEGFMKKYLQEEKKLNEAPFIDNKWEEPLNRNSIYPESLELLTLEEVNQLPQKVRSYICWWWLKSPGQFDDFALGVGKDGTVYSHGCIVDDTGAVRPVLTVSNLDSSNLELYDNYQLLDNFWIYIGDNKFLYDGIPVKHIFDKDSNDYESSEIKGYLDNWLKELQSKVLDKPLKEDTVKQNGKWVNKGKEGTHGKFKTKKQADAQRKAMFANGYRESLQETLMDAVLDRIDGVPYNPREFYHYVNGWYDDVAHEMDEGEEIDVANAIIRGLKDSIRGDGGEPNNTNARQLYQFVKDSTWLTNDKTADKPQYLIDIEKEFLNESQSKPLTWKEFYDLALRNYAHGGDGVVECWDESTFDEYVRTNYQRVCHENV